MSFAYHHLILAVAATVCLFGTWVGMRHFARARATAGAIRFGWLFMASVGTGAALWAATFISVLALDPTLSSAFALAPTAGVLLIGIAACLAGFEIGSRPRPQLAPELGGLVLGAGIIAMHYVALYAWQAGGSIQWNWYGVGLTLALGLSLSALSVSRANRPVTRYCRHGAAIVMTFMIAVMHYAIAGSMSVSSVTPVALDAGMIPATTLSIGLIGAVLLVIGSGFASYIIDLRTRTEASNRMHQLSFNDTMTGLPNRMAFNERLAFATSQAHEVAHKVAAFSIDIDGFKDINDIYGHSAGDLLLIEAAARMRAQVSAGDFLARQNGDEFLGLQMSGNHPADAQQFAQRIAAAFATPFEIHGQPITLTASIGYAIFPTDTPLRDQLLSDAKLAMLRGKSTHYGRITPYQRDMEDAARTRRALARDLHGAAERGELALHYQLQARLSDGALRGAEALMRWTHPKRGTVSPAVFIPLAEESETILVIGEWALRRACRDAAGGLVAGTVAVNLSPVQLMRDDLAEIVLAILVETGLPPDRLEIEITESTMMRDQARSVAMLRRLKALGVSIAIDDFGTGHSSLATLHAFNFDKIKLDQSFVKRLPSDGAAAAIVGTVMALGRRIGVPVLAEGIETREQWDCLAREGCAMGQGYLLSRPVPIDALARATANAAVLADEMTATASPSRPWLGPTPPQQRKRAYVLAEP